VCKKKKEEEEEETVFVHFKGQVQPSRNIIKFTNEGKVGTRYKHTHDWKGDRKCA
jgi:hypothetical protein